MEAGADHDWHQKAEETVTAAEFLSLSLVILRDRCKETKFTGDPKGTLEPTTSSHSYLYQAVLTRFRVGFQPTLHPLLPEKCSGKSPTLVLLEAVAQTCGHQIKSDNQVKYETINYM